MFTQIYYSWHGGVYIYIYIEREREREREITVSSREQLLCLKQL